MADFNQTQSELDQFLENQFAPQQQQQSTEEPKDDVKANIAEFLEPDEEVPAETPAQHTYTPAQQTQQQRPAVSDTDRIIALERELAATRTRSQMYEQAFAQQQHQQAMAQQPQRDYTKVFDDTELSVDERYTTDYGDADPYIRSLAKQVANDMYQRTVLPLQQEVMGLRQQLDATQQYNGAQATQVFEMQLQQIVPDVAAIANSAEWQSFIRQPAPYSGGSVSIADLVVSGIQSGNTRQVVDIINDFKRTRSATPTQQQVSPGRSQTTLPQTQQRDKPMLKMSNFDRATEKFQAGKMSWDEYQTVMDEFTIAQNEGRVNYSK